MKQERQGDPEATEEGCKDTVPSLLQVGLALGALALLGSICDLFIWIFTERSAELI